MPSHHNGFFVGSQSIEGFSIRAWASLLDFALCLHFFVCIWCLVKLIASKFKGFFPFFFDFFFKFFRSLVAPPLWLACWYYYLVLVAFSFSNMCPLFGFASWSFSTLLLNVPLHVFPPLLPCGGLVCNNCL